MQADAQFHERQSEVLDDPILAPIPSGAGAAEAVAENNAAADLQDESAIDLPDSVGSSEATLGDVYLEESEDQPDAELEMADDTISVDFPDQDVRSIIRDVADLYELNVVIPDTLVGSVSLKLRQVSWRQVFDVVLEPLNYTWIEDGNIIKIKSIDDLLAEPVFNAGLHYQLCDGRRDPGFGLADGG